MKLSDFADHELIKKDIKKLMAEGVNSDKNNNKPEKKKDKIKKPKKIKNKINEKIEEKKPEENILEENKVKLSDFADYELVKRDIKKIIDEGVKADMAEEIMTSVKKHRDDREPKEELKEIENEELPEENIVEEPKEIPQTDADRANKYLEEVIVEDDESKIADTGTRLYLQGSGVGPKELRDTIRIYAKDATYSGNQTIAEAIAEISATATSANIVCASEVINDSTVSGDTVDVSLNYLEYKIDAICLSAGAVASVFGRAGIVVATSGDYDASEITYGAANVNVALNDHDSRLDVLSAGIYTSANFYSDLSTASIGDLGSSAHTHTSADIVDIPVTSVFGRTGDVVAVSSDYSSFYYQKSEINNLISAFDTNVVFKTAAYSATSADGTILCSASDVTLPAPTGLFKKKFNIKNRGNDDSVVNVKSGGTIDKETSQTVGSYENITVISDGTEYWIL